ncbi:MAG: hypothetical protein FWD93_03225 [Coriobacteriia bacterium]|nr:hypothetical protein [Coriobacteriia bacterium]
MFEMPLEKLRISAALREVSEREAILMPATLASMLKHLGLVLGRAYELLHSEVSSLATACKRLHEASFAARTLWARAL